MKQLINRYHNNHQHQTLGLVLENNCPKNYIKEYQGLGKNIGGYMKKPMKRSSYSCKRGMLSGFSFTEVIWNLHRYNSINAAWIPEQTLKTAAEKVIESSEISNVQNFNTKQINLKTYDSKIILIKKY